MTTSFSFPAAARKREFEEAIDENETVDIVVEPPKAEEASTVHTAKVVKLKLKLQKSVRKATLQLWK